MKKRLQGFSDIYFVLFYYNLVTCKKKVLDEFFYNFVVFHGLYKYQTKLNLKNLRNLKLINNNKKVCLIYELI